MADRSFCFPALRSSITVLSGSLYLVSQLLCIVLLPLPCGEGWGGGQSNSSPNSNARSIIFTALRVRRPGNNRAGYGTAASCLLLTKKIHFRPAKNLQCYPPALRDSLHFETSPYSAEQLLPRSASRQRRGSAENVIRKGGAPTACRTIRLRRNGLQGGTARRVFGSWQGGCE